MERRRLPKEEQGHEWQNTSGDEKSWKTHGFDINAHINESPSTRGSKSNGKEKYTFD
jgi:hypothetical protein